MDSPHATKTPPAKRHWLVEVALGATDAAGAETIDPSLTTPSIWIQAADSAQISEAELACRVAERFSLRVADLENAEAQATRFVPERLARSALVFPLRADDQEIFVATCDPTDLNAEEQLRFASGRRPVFEIASPGMLEKTIEAHYRPESAAANLLTDIGAEVEGIHLVEEDSAQPLEEEDASCEPVVKLGNLILREAITHRASDIHLAPGRAVGTVHLRIDGVMQLRMRIPMPVLHRVISRIKILGGMDIADRLRPQDGRARIRIEDGYYDLRISTVPTRDAEKAVIRVLYADTAPGLAELHMPDHDLDRFRSMLSHRDSIVLVTGPTGSGKTTTLYAALQELNTGDVNIMTVEDPVEYELVGITQIQVETRRGVTFASALRAILRQDPDIILLGEIRDEETAEIAVQAAQTGHLVLATLHTNEALGVVSRLQDLQLAPASIADSVCGMIAQRLVRTLCDDCAETIDGELTADEQRLVADYGVTPLRRAVGCRLCDEIGYKGRRPVIETARPTTPLRQLILDGAGIDALRGQAVDDGMHTLHEAALGLVREGITTLDEVDRALGEMTRNASVPPSEPDASHTQEPPVDAMASADAMEAIAAAEAMTSASAPTEPIAPAGEPAPAASLASPSDREAAEDGGGRAGAATTVLVADDDPMIRKIAQKLLTDDGFVVIVAEDGVAALEKLNSDDPRDHVDVMISDLDMPRLNGYDLLRLTRSAPRTAALPIVVLTGEDDPETEAKLIEGGADDYIRKPIDAVRFLARLKAVLRRAHG